MDSLKPYCTNCEEVGHSMVFCTAKKQVIEMPKVTCSNCNNNGHYIKATCNIYVIEHLFIGTPRPPKVSGFCLNRSTDIADSFFFMLSYYYKFISSALVYLNQMYHLLSSCYSNACDFQVNVFCPTRQKRMRSAARRAGHPVTFQRPPPPAELDG
jgi:hypothetical protein